MRELNFHILSQASVLMFVDHMNLRIASDKQLREKCLFYRATYLDIVLSYSTEQCLQTFRRFVTIRG